MFFSYDGMKYRTRVTDVFSHRDQIVINVVMDFFFVQATHFVFSPSCFQVLSHGRLGLPLNLVNFVL